MSVLTRGPVLWSFSGKLPQVTARVPAAKRSTQPSPLGLSVSSQCPAVERSEKEDSVGCLAGHGLGESPRADPLRIRWPGKQCPHVAPANLSRSCLPSSNESICFFFPCHKDEVSYCFIATSLNSSPCRVGPAWAGVCAGFEAWSRTRVLGRAGAAVSLLVLFVQIYKQTGPSSQSRSGVGHIGPCKPPSQDRGVFRRSPGGSSSSCVLSHLISVEQ